MSLLSLRSCLSVCLNPRPLLILFLSLQFHLPITILLIHFLDPCVLVELYITWRCRVILLLKLFHLKSYSTHIDKDLATFTLTLHNVQQTTDLEKKEARIE